MTGFYCSKLTSEVSVVSSPFIVASCVLALEMDEVFVDTLVVNAVSSVFRSEIAAELDARVVPPVYKVPSTTPSRLLISLAFVYVYPLEAPYTILSSVVIYDSCVVREFVF